MVSGRLVHAAAGRITAVSAAASRVKLSVAYWAMRLESSHRADYVIFVVDNSVRIGRLDVQTSLQIFPGFVLEHHSSPPF